MTVLDAALNFVACINRHDMTGLTALMTPDHRFIDSLGSIVTGREALREGWRHYFQLVPDYHIDVSRSFTDKADVVLLGLARGTCSRHGMLDPVDAWQMPAAWRVLVRNGLIAEWQVYADNEPIRQRMARASA